MSHLSYPEVLMEAAGVKVITPLSEDENSAAPGKIILKMEKINGASEIHGKSCGFHLTKSKWDPYPWIGYVENNSPADLAGLRAGDYLLAVNDTDLLGLTIKQIASLIRNEEGVHDASFSIWRYPYQNEEQNKIGLALKGPLPDVARNLASALSRTVRSLECPVCLENAAPPVSQCVHGHILCVVCRSKTTRCPICRVKLGQGRCLVADKLHRIFCDTFNMDGDKTVNKMITNDYCNLHDRLFGPNNRKQEPVVTKNNITSKPRQFLLARLLFGDREKAVSAENLTRVSEASVPQTIDTMNGSRVQFSLNDRTKSASIGELPRDTVVHANSSQFSELNNELPGPSTSQQSLSLPQTPIWGGSTDSICYAQLACPLLKSCREVMTIHTLLEHIKTHSVPQIHFYFGNGRIPLPFPFGRDAFYIFHYGEDIFFLQHAEEMVWMLYPAKMACTNNMWEWTLHGWSDNGTEIQMRRQVASLEDPVTLSSQHVAQLPNTLLLKTMNIQIFESRSHDKLYV